MPLISADLELGATRHACASCRTAAAPPSFGGPSAEKHYPPDLGLESQHIDLDLVLDLEAQSAKLVVTHTVRANRDGVTTLVLDGLDFLDLTVEDRGGAALTHAYDGQKITVTWQMPWRGGDTRQLRLTYRVEKPVSGLIFSKPDVTYPKRPLYAATDHETERARHWLACVDLPSVRTTLAFRITAAESLTILANGALESETRNDGGTKTAVWRLSQRCPSYLVCFAVGDFVRYDDTPVDGMPVAYFATRDLTAEDLHRSFGKTPQMLAWITRKLGVRFPFPKYYQFALPHFGGAMENISLVSWSDEILVGPNSGADRQWICDQTNVHEMAHSYFGDLVVCRDFAHAWLKESWATYMETCWLEDEVSRDEMLYDLYRNAQAYIDEADNRYSRPLVTRSFTSSWQMYDRHLYPGGACRLHTLRRELGDEVFWRAVTDYIQTYREQVVETDDFRRVMERHSGRSLQKFFDQWTETAAYPSLKVSFSYDAEKKIGSFEVEQKQVDDKKGIPVFELTTELAWTNAAGKTESRVVRLDKSRQSFTFPMGEDPEQVRFDPTWRALHKLDFNPGDAKLKKQLTGATDVLGRIHAAAELCKTGKRSNVKAVIDALAKEPFWGVRREMIKALEKTRSNDAAAALALHVARETDANVLPTLFTSAAVFREPEVRDALLARLEQGGLPSSGEAGLMTALGALRQLTPLDVLKRKAETFDAPHGVVQGAALHALGTTREEALIDYLLERSVYGKLSYRIRANTARALGALGYYAPDKKRRRDIEERLVDLLRDDQRAMRDAAAAAIHRAGLSDSRAALVAYRNTLPFQDRPTVDGYLKALAEGEGEKVKSLEKQLDEVNEKLRKLLDRVQDLEDKK
jgi:aminopeptidase N